MLKKYLSLLSVLATFAATGVFADDIKKVDDETPEVVEQKLVVDEEDIDEEKKKAVAQVQVKEEEEEEVKSKTTLAGCPNGNCPVDSDSDEDEEEETPVKQAKLV